MGGRQAAVVLAIAVVATGLLYTPPAAADTHSAVRAFDLSEVAPGGEVTVTVSARGFGPFARVSEILPEGWTYTSSSLPDAAVSVEDSVVRFIVLDDGEFNYTVTAPDIEGAHVFSGLIEDSQRRAAAVRGAREIVVRAELSESGEEFTDIANLERQFAERQALLNGYRCRFDVDIQLVPRGCLEGRPVSPDPSPPLFVGITGIANAMEGLLAAQQTLFDAYRCRFDIVFRAVSGKCQEGPAVDPAPSTPSPAGVPSIATAMDGLVAAQQSLLNAYRCWFGIQTKAVTVGCSDSGNSVSYGRWSSFDGFKYNHSDMDRPRQVGVFTESIRSAGLSEGVKAELRVACFYVEGEDEGTLTAYIDWNTFVASRDDTYDLTLEFGDSESTAFDAANSTINEASMLLNAADSAQFSRSVIESDAETVTASVSIPLGPFGAGRISATFHLEGSNAAIQSALDRCHMEAASDG